MGFSAQFAVWAQPIVLFVFPLFCYVFGRTLCQTCIDTAWTVLWDCRYRSSWPLKFSAVSRVLTLYIRCLLELSWLSRSCLTMHQSIIHSYNKMAFCESSEAVNKVPLHSGLKTKSRNNQGFDTISGEETPEVSRANAKSVLFGENNNLAASHFSHLSNLYRLKVDYSLGTFLQNVCFCGSIDSPLKYEKTSRFPCSRFSLEQNVENRQKYELASNFSGSRYNLSSEKGNVLTIVFLFSCGIAAHRQFQMYAIKPAYAYSDLEASGSHEDLDKLFTIGANNTKIMKLTNIEPEMHSESGQLILEFVRKSVVPSVKNAVIVNGEKRQVMQMYKVKGKDQIFQIYFSPQFPLAFSFAFALASLDFKLALQ